MKRRRSCNCLLPPLTWGTCLGQTAAAPGGWRRQLVFAQGQALPRLWFCPDCAIRRRRYAGLDSNGGCYRVRFEGCGAYQCNSADSVWELSFCPDGAMSLCTGSHGRLDGSAGASNGLDWVRAAWPAAMALWCAAVCGCK
jgi:hypothetical protein